MTAPEDLLTAAKAVIEKAYCPYSKFSVAAALRAKNGKIYSGCNIENASYPVGICAEMAAMSTLVSDGNREITEALVLIRGDKAGTPCGKCRQGLLEFARKNTVIHTCSTEGDHAAYTMEELLPHAFSSKFLED